MVTTRSGKRFHPYLNTAKKIAKGVVKTVGTIAKVGATAAQANRIYRDITKAVRPKQKKKGKKAVYHTMGKWAGKFRRKKFRRKVKKAFRSGAVTISERRGTITDSHCVYVGHATCPREATIKNVLRCVLKVKWIFTIGIVSTVRDCFACLG